MLIRRISIEVANSRREGPIVRSRTPLDDLHPSEVSVER